MISFILAQTQEAPTSQPTDVLAAFILPLIPWLIIFGFIWFFVYRGSRRRNKMVEDHYQRAVQHWTTVEEKMDRILAAIEQPPKNQSK